MKVQILTINKAGPEGTLYMPEAGFDPPIIMPEGHYLSLWLTNDLSHHGWITLTNSV